MNLILILKNGYNAARQRFPSVPGGAQPAHRRQSFKQWRRKRRNARKSSDVPVTPPNVQEEDAADAQQQEDLQTSFATNEAVAKTLMAVKDSGKELVDAITSDEVKVVSGDCVEEKGFEQYQVYNGNLFHILPK
jgi:hypothetical protein